MDDCRKLGLTNSQIEIQWFRWEFVPIMYRSSGISSDYCSRLGDDEKPDFFGYRSCIFFLLPLVLRPRWRLLAHLVTDLSRQLVDLAGDPRIADFQVRLGQLLQFIDQ